MPDDLDFGDYAVTTMSINYGGLILLGGTHGIVVDVDGGLITITLLDLPIFSTKLHRSNLKKVDPADVPHLRDKK